MKKILTFAFILVSASCFARGPRPVFHHHHHGPSVARVVVAGAVGGLVAGVVHNVVAPPPRQVWIPPYYVTQIVNGVPCQVLIPGHWEYR